MRQTVSYRGMLRRIRIEHLRRVHNIGFLLIRLMYGHRVELTEIGGFVDVVKAVLRINLTSPQNISLN